MIIIIVYKYLISGQNLSTSLVLIGQFKLTIIQQLTVMDLEGGEIHMVQGNLLFAGSGTKKY